jgi:membrane protease YdiL (CAAX protease family)
MFNIKEVPWKIILVWLAVSMGLTALINLVLFPGPFFDPIARATAGLVNATLQANLLSLTLFALIIFGWARLRPSDVGLEWSKLPQALFLTVLLWLATQAMVLLIGGITGDIHLNPAWSERGVPTVLGALIAQLAGNAFFEEVNYRGFYLSQLCLKIRMPDERVRRWWAILYMLGLFVLSHIPNRIFNGYSLAEIPLDFVLLFSYGLFFTGVYLISGNLFLAIGVHALVNNPTLITEAPLPAQIVLFLLTCILLAVLRRRTRSFEQQAIAP